MAFEPAQSIGHLHEELATLLREIAAALERDPGPGLTPGTRTAIARPMRRALCLYGELREAGYGQGVAAATFKRVTRRWAGAPAER